MLLDNEMRDDHPNSSLGLLQTLLFMTSTVVKERDRELKEPSLEIMASAIMTASMLGRITISPPSTNRSRVITSSMKRAVLENVKVGAIENKKEGRRDLIFAVATAAAYSVARMAVAAEEPKPGSAEAKKLYAAVCVANPTAKICRN